MTLHTTTVVISNMVVIDVTPFVMIVWVMVAIIITIDVALPRIGCCGENRYLHCTHLITRSS